MNFRTIPGKEKEKNYLRKSIDNGRLGHAQLFVGGEGSGQLALAWAAASYILCNDRKDGDTCGVCTSCVKTAKMIHPDLHFAFPVTKMKDKKRSETTSNDFMPLWRNVVAENPYIDIHTWINAMESPTSSANINKEECVNIIRKLELKPFESAYKVVILWMPEYLQNEGNRLLKIIEEPVEGTYFFLVADDSNKILNTILSRTQLLKVNRFHESEIAHLLKESYDLDDAAVEQIITLADSNMSKAIAFANGNEEDHATLFVEWLRAAYSLDPVKIQQPMTSILAMSKENQKTFFQYGSAFVKHIMNVHNNLPVRASSLEDTIRRMASIIDLDICDGIVAHLDELIKGLNRNLNMKIAVMSTSVEIGEMMRSGVSSASILD